MRLHQKLLAIIILIIPTISVNAQSLLEERRWSREKIKEWYADQEWIVGANFVPSTAINQLEMWQKETFDTETIDRELGYAQDIGMNAMRVYLHSLAYQADKEGFKERLDQYLNLAQNNGIKTIFVFFDDVWDPAPKLGKQPEPEPGVHNSGWVQDPGYPASKEESKFKELEGYVKDILQTFADDERVLFWDLYNEPGNNDKGNESLPLLKKVFTWAREVNPSQPISVGLWKWELTDLNAFQAVNSDLITYHSYDEPEIHSRIIELLKSHDRPIVCTEYMARTRNNRFPNTLPMLKAENIGAVNWGLVNGKSNTIYAWNTPVENGEEPIEWFHDIFRKDGTPYRQDEINLIKNLTDR